MSRILFAAAVALAGVAAVLLLIWLGQRRMIYFPFGGVVPHPREVGLASAEEVTLRTEDGLMLGAWFVRRGQTAGRVGGPGSTDGAAGWTVILFNGNGGDRTLRVPLARRLAEEGIGVLMVDYRGYGGNPGSPTEAGLLRDARAARRWADERLRDGRGRIAYLGESLGTGVAVALAAEKQPDALILRSPYTSLADVGAHHYPFLPVRWLLRDRYASVERMAGLSCPVLVIAAERDSVVPAALSRRLFEAAPASGRRWLLLPGADHNDMEALAGDAVISAIVGLLSAAPTW